MSVGFWLCLLIISFFDFSSKPVTIMKQKMMVVNYGKRFITLINF